MDRPRTHSVVDPMRGYQKTALEFLLDGLFVRGKKGRGLFLDPGLGKTRTSLEMMNALFSMGESKRALVIAPKRVCHLVWPAEAAKWQMPWQVRVMCGRVKDYLAGGVSPYIKVEVVNPESLHLLEPYAGRWDTVIVDESTKFKNWTSKRMKCLRKLLPSFDRRIILTGTPAANSLADLHSQIFILDDGEALGRNVTVFRARFMRQGGYLGRQWQLRDGLEDELLDAIGHLVLRMDAESYLDMPKLIINDMWCKLPPEAEREYQRLKRILLAQLESGDILCTNAASAYNKCRQLANGSIYDSDRNVHFAHAEKLDMLSDLIDELSGKPLLAFYQFGHDAVAICERYPKAAVLCGATSARVAQDYVDRWNGGDLPLFLVQNQAASHGLNLQGSGSDVAYYGLGDSLEIFEQSYRRIYRQGTKSSQIRVHRLLTHATVDGIIAQRLDGKAKTQSDFLEALKAHAAS